MLGKRRAEWVLRLLVADVAALLVAFLVAYWLRVALNRPIGRAAGPLAHYLWLLGLIVPVWVGLLAVIRRLRRPLDDAARGPGSIVRVSGVGLLLLTAGLFLVKGSEVNRSVLVLFAGVSGVGLWAERALVLAWLRRSRAAASAGRAWPWSWARETARAASSPPSGATRRRAGWCAAA